MMTEPALDTPIESAPQSGVEGLSACLSTLAAADLPSAELRPRVLAAARAAIDVTSAEIRGDFYAGDARGADVVKRLTAMVDTLTQALFSFATRTAYPLSNPTEGERLAVVAVGGYGRAELCPQSDIDLLILFPYKRTAHHEQVIEYLLYLLWDLGFRVGQAARSLDECIRLAKQDITIRTALLEARQIAGDKELFDTLRRRFRDEVAKGTGPDFVEAKLAERDERHRKVGDSRYVLEPNVKEGKGGLRDLHTLFWIAKYIYGTARTMVDLGVVSQREARRFAKAQNFLWNVRCHLHYLTGREEDRLTFDMQPEIARHLGYTDHVGARGVERFMKHYYLYAKEVGGLTRIFCAALEDQHQRRPRLRLPSFGLGRREVDGFALERGRVRVVDENAFSTDPVALIRMFHVALGEDVDIHPATLRLITRSLPLIDDQLRGDAEANRLFLEILTSKINPEPVLRRMNEAGVFGRFIPDFGRVVAQMQHDMYHVYTVDEHTIFALGILHGIELGEYKDDMPVASEVIHKVASRRALYVALLFHDIAKGRGGDHSVLGAEVVQRLGPRLGLTAEETETAAWLVRHHLLISNTAYRRDIHDPQTLADFTAVVQSPERLRLLLCLTVADIRAVGPNVWNAWKAALMRELYLAAEDALSGQPTPARRAERVAAAKDAARARLDSLTAEEFASFAEQGYAPYWLAFDADTHARHAALFAPAQAAGAPLTIETTIDTARAVTEVTVYGVDDPGLFARIAGAMALAGVNIVDAKIFTMADGMALDAFWVQDADGNAVTDAAALKRLTVTLEKVISRQRRLGARLGLKATLPSRTRVFHDQSRVLIDNKASAAYTVIEVNGRDRPGFLYDVTAALAALNLQISSAKISTYGTRAVDVFYVKDLFGLQVTHEARLGEIRARLTEAIGDADPDKPVAAEKSPAKKTRAKKNPQKKAPAKTAAAKTAAKVKPASSRKTAKKRTSAEARGGATSRTAPRRG